MTNLFKIASQCICKCQTLSLQHLCNTFFMEGPLSALQNAPNKIVQTNNGGRFPEVWPAAFAQDAWDRLTSAKVGLHKCTHKNGQSVNRTGPLLQALEGNSLDNMQEL